MFVLIDNYDSFTWNLWHFLSDLGAEVKTIRNDVMSVEEILSLKPSGLVLSPGPGVPADKIDLIFEKFARLSAKATAGSAGLGLPISRQIMLNLGGALDYLQRPAGSTFRVTTPVSRADTAVQSAA